MLSFNRPKVVDFAAEWRKRRKPDAAGLPRSVRDSKVAERIVGHTARAALTPCTNCPGDETCPTYSATKKTLGGFGLADCDRLAAAMAGLTRSVRGHGCRTLKTHAADAFGLSMDECLLVSLVAACQHGETDAAYASAYALLETGSGINCAIANGVAVARALAEQGISLSENSILSGLAFVPTQGGTH